MGFGLPSVPSIPSGIPSSPFGGDMFNIPNPIEDLSGVLNQTIGTILSPLTNLTKGLGSILPTILVGGAIVGGIILIKK
ncbi:MAG: hypothetical protein U9P79_06790 [Candidatus Cloacimonadota bacterium]|nr:hypothetical protein [Candidatus Cloacimonadota bacterium]